MVDPKARIEARPVTTNGHANKGIANLKRENRGGPLGRVQGFVVIELDVTLAKPGQAAAASLVAKPCYSN